MKTPLLISLAMLWSSLALAQAAPNPDEFAKRLKQIEYQYATANNISIAYKEIGDTQDPPVLMIMGLGASHLLWGEGLPFELADAGYRTIIFDNRDVGESQKFTEHGDPTIWWEMIKAFFGFEVDAPYSLKDMAADSVGLMDSIGIERAHVVGVSMGGMIAQVLAAQYPERVVTLTSIMSSPAMFGGDLPPPDEQDNDLINDAAAGESDAAERFRAFGLHPEAFPRQIAAIMKSGDRSEEVRTITTPTLVLHGEDDTLVKPEHGKRTAELISDSEYITYPGMAHNMPPEVLPKLVADIVGHISI